MGPQERDELGQVVRDDALAIDTCARAHAHKQTHALTHAHANTRNTLAFAHACTFKSLNIHPFSRYEHRNFAFL